MRGRGASECADADEVVPEHEEREVIQAAQPPKTKGARSKSATKNIPEDARGDEDANADDNDEIQEVAPPKNSAGKAAADKQPAKASTGKSQATIQLVRHKDSDAADDGESEMDVDEEPPKPALRGKGKVSLKVKPKPKATSEVSTHIPNCRSQLTLRVAETKAYAPEEGRRGRRRQRRGRRRARPIT